MKFFTRVAWVLSSCILFVVGCAGPGFNGDKTVTAASSGSAPDWVKDSRAGDQKNMISRFDDNSEHPNFYYLVSQAHVDNESLVQSCYNFARANASNELGSSINQYVTGTVSSASDSSSDSQYAVSTIQTKTALVGSQVMARYWDKARDKDLSEQVTCYVVIAIPMKNFTRLKDIALKKASRTAMDKDTQENAENAKDPDRGSP